MRDNLLPSNRKFGFFFSSVFTAAAAYSHYNGYLVWAYSSISMALTFIIVTLANDHLLLPLNRLWMRFGILLGIMVSPIVLGVLFFGLFTPIAMVMRLIGRDELRLKLYLQSSYWISRVQPIKSESFLRQF